MARLKEKYRNEILSQMKKEFQHRNDFEVPRVEKVVINMGIGEAIQNIKVIDHAVEELSLITGQRPIVKRAKKSVSNFKLREGMPIGCSVTLRRKRMYEFPTGEIYP